MPPGCHALALHAQDVDDVRVRDRADVGRDGAAERLDPARQQRRRRRRASRARRRARAPARASGRRASGGRRRRSRRAARRAARAPPRIAYRSSRAWVGCWCFPSPALTTCALVHAATSCGRADRRVADDDHVRVVRREREDRVLQRLALVRPRSRPRGSDIVSAESRFAASSKLASVRVEDS